MKIIIIMILIITRTYKSAMVSTDAEAMYGYPTSCCGVVIVCCTDQASVLKAISLDC